MDGAKPWRGARALASQDSAAMVVPPAARANVRRRFRALKMLFFQVGTDYWDTLAIVGEGRTVFEASEPTRQALQRLAYVKALWSAEFVIVEHSGAQSVVQIGDEVEYAPT